MKNLFPFTFSLIILLFTGISSVAQNDAKAHEILKGVSAKYKTFNSLEADFTLTLDNPSEKIKDTQKGKVALKGNKYWLEIGGQTIVSDGKTVWTYLKDANEVQITEATNDKDAITPTNIFTVYEKGFKSKFVEEKKVNGKTMQIIELVPEDAKKPFFKVQLTIDKVDKMIQSAKLFDKNGNHYIYTLDNITPNAVSSENIFTFNTTKYPKIEVVDLR
ncbi:MAG: LolA family protein [Bacteroidia bacterium]